MHEGVASKCLVAVPPIVIQLYWVLSAYPILVSFILILVLIVHVLVNPGFIISHEHLMVCLIHSSCWFLALWVCQCHQWFIVLQYGVHSSVFRVKIRLVDERFEGRRDLFLEHLIPLNAIAPGMILNILCSSISTAQPPLGILVEQTLQQTPAIFGQRLRDLDGRKHDVLVHLLPVLWKEGRKTTEDLKE